MDNGCIGLLIGILGGTLFRGMGLFMGSLGVKYSLCPTEHLLVKVDGWGLAGISDIRPPLERLFCAD